VMFAQGVPFFHAGDDILRSKSGDTDSYNSGDWFNQVDWTMTKSGWGLGLPGKEKNNSAWSILRPLLRNAAVRPQEADIKNAHEVFKDMLRLRKAEPMFRLRTPEEIQAHVTFPASGATQPAGLIAMRLSQNAVSNGTVEGKAGDLMVVFNGTPAPKSFQAEEFKGQVWELHGIQANGHDEVVKTSKFHPLTGEFTAAQRSAAVFVKVPGTPKLLPDPIQPTCSCATTGPNAALAAALLALAALWQRRRRATSSTLDGRKS
jgi:pullulanase